jgi:murein DD-endopeptidase MepM/ murein hydrolase activator NlpD
VLAVEAGTVTHVGTVAGRGTVTVLHADGLSSTYEPVAGSVPVGARVAVGDVLGVLEDAAVTHCGGSGCLHLGARRPPAYLDPLPLLTGGGRIRLLPLGPAP